MVKGFGGLMRQAQLMKKKMSKLNEELENQLVEGNAGHGQVKVKATCGIKIKSVEIDPNVVNLEDIETMEDLITIATNDAIDKAQKVKENKMDKITGGLSGKLPGLI